MEKIEKTVKIALTIVTIVIIATMIINFIINLLMK
jgi:hypothetical protein